jgi:hypothetical protein
VDTAYNQVFGDQVGKVVDDVRDGARKVVKKVCKHRGIRINCTQQQRAIAMTRRFNLKIYTKNCCSCGTDSDVKAMLRGSNGMTTGWHLLDKDGYNDFEQGDVDDYVITSQKAFIPDTLCLSGDGWCVKSDPGVKVYNADFPKVNIEIGAAYNFPDLMDHTTHCVQLSSICD